MEFTCASRCEIHIINALSARLPLSIHVFLPLEGAAGWARAPSEALPHSIILQHTHKAEHQNLLAIVQRVGHPLIAHSKRERKVYYETTTNRGKR